MRHRASVGTKPQTSWVSINLNCYWGSVWLPLIIITMTLSNKILIGAIGWVGLVCAFLFYLHNNKPNGFKRGRIYQAQQLQVLDLKYNGWYIAGLSRGRIYLGRVNAPLGLLSCNYRLQDTLHHMLPFNPRLKLDWKVARTRIDSPYIYLYDYKTPTLFSAGTVNKKQTGYPLTGMHFDLMQLLSPGSIIVNGYEAAIGQKSVQKVWLRNKPYVDNSQSYAHAMQAAGNFSIDGFITINRKENAVLFTYYYRNQFVCLDTNLNLRYMGKTIDTNALAKLKVEALQVKGKMVRTVTGIPAIVNKRAYSDGGFIYIQAGLKADNESLMPFEEPITIDVYRLATGVYSHSLHLPEYKSEALTGFALRGNMLIAIYGPYLVTYSINTNKIPLKN